jgi:hypothetical protein
LLSPLEYLKKQYNVGADNTNPNSQNYSPLLDQKNFIPSPWSSYATTTASIITLLNFKKNKDAKNCVFFCLRIYLNTNYIQTTQKLPLQVNGQRTFPML